MKGIILSGGKGTRLSPLTLVVHKGLLPIYDKPMIYYPVNTLLEAGIKEILVIATKDFISMYKNLLKDGDQFGVKLKYEIEEDSIGTGQALTIGKDFIKDDDVCLIYGDNIFFGNLKDSIKVAKKNAKNGEATIFLYQVDESESSRYGIVELDKDNKVISLEEKPKNPKSNYAITGLYVFTSEAIKYSKELTLSERGELELTDVIKKYLDAKKLKAVRLKKDIKWIDAGNKDSLLEASIYAKKSKD